MFESQLASFDGGSQIEVGRFQLDKYSNKSTDLKVYFPEPSESYVKTLSVTDEQGKSYSTLMDSSSFLHYLSVYDVPFDQVDNLNKTFI